MVYLLAYDLDVPGQNYLDLTDSLEQAGAIRILESTWVLSSNESSREVRLRYDRYLDVNDRIFVCRADGWSLRHVMHQDEAVALLNS